MLQKRKHTHTRKRTQTHAKVNQRGRMHSWTAQILDTTPIIIIDTTPIIIFLIQSDVEPRKKMKKVDDVLNKPNILRVWSQKEVSWDMITWKGNEYN